MSLYLSLPMYNLLKYRTRFVVLSRRQSTHWDLEKLSYHRLLNFIPLHNTQTAKAARIS